MIRYELASATAVQLKVGVVDTAVAPFAGADSLGGSRYCGGGTLVVNDHFTDQVPYWVALRPCTSQ